MDLSDEGVVHWFFRIREADLARMGLGHKNNPLKRVDLRLYHALILRVF